MMTMTRLLRRLLQSRRRRVSLLRWRIGHQMFIELDQMMIAIVSDLDRALAVRDWARAEDRFRMMAQMFLASTSALRFTGDLGAGRYEGLVVPDMTLFYPEPGMSGSNMQEHLMLVEGVRGITEEHEDTIRHAPNRVYDAYQQYVHARSAALDAHRNVCEWSAGHRPSLATRKGKKGMPAAEKLARMARAHRKAMHIEHAGAERLEAGDRAPKSVESVALAADASGRVLEVAIATGGRCPVDGLVRLVRRVLGHSAG